MQSSFIAGLMELSSKDQNIMYLTADSGEGGLDLLFRRNFPRQSFDFGIAEENMVAAAAGMALCGKIPFIYTAAPFLAYRAYEFIRNDVCLQNVPVKIFGSGSGISVSSLGPTHHSTEDIAVLNCLPNLTILSPATPKQAYEAVEFAYNVPGPVYVRLGMNKEKEFFGEEYKICAGGFEIIKEGRDIGIITTGAILSEVMKADEILFESDIHPAVASVFSIKPFDSVAFLKFTKDLSQIVVVEEHNVIGGLGSLVIEELFLCGRLLPVIRIGLRDCFSKGYGSVETVRKSNGLDAQSIAGRVREING